MKALVADIERKVLEEIGAQLVVSELVQLADEKSTSRQLVCNLALRRLESTSPVIRLFGNLERLEPSLLE